LAPLVKFVNAKVILSALNISSFFGLLYFGYLYLRKSRLPVFLSLVSVFAFSFNLAWSHSLLQQPFYDRLFIALSFLFALSCVKDKFSPLLFLVCLVISSLIVEKALIYNVIFLFSYIFINFKNIEKPRLYYFLVSTFLCLILFFLITKFFLNNPYYQSAIPHSLTELISRIVEITTQKEQANKTITFLFEVFPVLLLSIFFAFRFFILAFIILMPNIIGNIGGAEKIAFYTHYHSLYLGFIFFVFLLSISKLYESKIKFRSIFLLLYLTLLIPFYLFFSINSKNLYEFKYNNLNYISDLVRFYNSQGTAQVNQDLITNLIPQNSALSVSESAMPYVYNYRNLSFFPYNYEASDFLIVSYSLVDNKKIPYFMTFLGEDHNIKSRLVIYSRLKNAGFKVDEPLAISSDFMIIGK
jgi:hypothetical protein